MSGAIVIVSPVLMSPSWATHFSSPVCASIAIVRLSSVLNTNNPSDSAAPRLTTSQQATPCAAASGFGSYFHFTGVPGCVRSSAYT